MNEVAKTSKPITNDRLRNTRAWAAARIGQLSGADVIVGAIDELLERRSNETGDGYKDGFYQITELLGWPAMPISPKEALETRILPQLRRLLAGSETPSAPETCEQSRATADVIAERRRQVDDEGWDAEHDDQYQNSGQMAQAAAAYALRASPAQYNHAHDLWPWSDEWWKPKDVRRDLVRAAALIIAEIERLDRHSQKAGEQPK